MGNAKGGYTGPGRTGPVRNRPPQVVGYGWQKPASPLYAGASDAATVCLIPVTGPFLDLSQQTCAPRFSDPHSSNPPLQLWDP